EDPTNQGNVGMLFIPAWWENPPASISNLRVAFVLPEGVKQGEIITGEIEYDNLFLENSNYVLFWERHDVPAETKYSFGVSFPEKYVDIRTTNFWEFFAPIAIAVALIASIAGAILIIFRIRKTSYEKPRIAIEALGPARGFTAVEAAEVVGFKPVRILTMILFGLILKRILKVLETEPVVRVERIEDQDEDYKKPLWYYEIDFLRGIGPRGFINEQNLARTYLSLRNNVDKKMRGYSREDTVNYYKSIVEKAWSQVIQATTPQLRGEAIETNLEWLLLDEKHKERFRSLSPDVLILPHPSWYWYLPHPISRSPQPSSNEVKPVPIQEFADNIVTGIEKTANGLVKNIEEFTNRLIPPKTKAISSRPIRKARCVCA
ncbi:MAG: hypothetical protein JSV20_09965, partial [Candidatus Bathyarchaeota archaeon]